MKSMKKCNKRMRSDEDPDEEYVPSIFLFREQRKVEVRVYLSFRCCYAFFLVELMP